MKRILVETSLTTVIYGIMIAIIWGTAGLQIFGSLVISHDFFGWLQLTLCFGIGTAIAKISFQKLRRNS